MNFPGPGLSCLATCVFSNYVFLGVIRHKENRQTHKANHNVFMKLLKMYIFVFITPAPSLSLLASLHIYIYIHIHLISIMLTTIIIAHLAGLPFFFGKYYTSSARDGGDLLVGFFHFPSLI